MANKEAPASQLLSELVEKSKNNKVISFGEIDDHLRERGFAVLMILFTIPVAIPIPGISTILGIPLIILSIQMIMGMEKPLLPQWVARKSINVAHLAFAIEKTTKYFLKIEKFLKPRLSHFSSAAGERMIGVMFLLCSITVALPIWGGNALPSIGILIMSFGLLGKDGVVIFSGIIVSILGLFVAYFIVFLFFYGAQMAAGSFLNDAYHYIISHIGFGKSLFED